jgi:hypothetical protein
LLEDYGDNSDKIYLQYHGFVADLNPFRCVELTAPAVTEDTSHAADTKTLLEALRFSPSEPPSYCVRESGTLDMALTVYMSVISFSAEDTARCLAKVRRGRGLGCLYEIV